MKTTSVIVAQEATVSYSPDVLALQHVNLEPLQPGEVKVRTIYLSLDPTHFNWLKLGRSKFLKETLGFDLGAGDVMRGPFIGIVEESRADGLLRGQLVTGFGPWQRDFNTAAEGLTLISPDAGEPLTAYLSIFSHIGLAAYSGVHGVLEVQPGQTVLVSGAAGATGSVAVELLVAAGARVIGIAGGPEKCAKVLSLGAYEAIDYRSEDVGTGIARAAPAGLDGFFDGVGGPTLDAAISNMKVKGRVAVCGIMSDYNLPSDQLHGFRNMYQLLIRSVRLEGFIAGQAGLPADKQIAELRRLFSNGKIRDRPHLVHGLENAAASLSLLYQGKNEGKLILQASPPPS